LKRKETLSEFLRGTGRELDLGEFVLRELKDGTYWIEHSSGEGTQVAKETLIDVIRQLFHEVF
jgi:hypothetical protein